MNTLDKEIQYAKFLVKPNKTIKELEHFYSTLFKSIYPFTTENLAGYYKYFDFSNKNYLTVTGSGDQTINAILCGCENIDCFDINPLTKYYQELKIQAIKDLDYYEFLMFFTHKITEYQNNKNSFYKLLYKKIRLKSCVKQFWDSLFEEDYNINNSQLFYADVKDLKTIIKINPYLNENNYYKLKNILNNKKININYYDLNLKDLYLLNKNYDLVNLSNIASYLDIIFDKHLLHNLKKTINKIHLNKNGKIIMNYFYEYMDNRLENDDIYSKYYRELIFDKDKIEYIEFEPIEEKSKILQKIFKYKDYVMLYKK